jgi:WD40 repeat protein
MSSASSTKPHKSKKRAAFAASESAASTAAAASSSPAHPPSRSPRIAAAETPHHPAPALPLSALPRFLHPLHRCRFVSLAPHSVTSLAFSPSGNLLAVGRSNGNIEIWRAGYNAANAPSAAAGWALLKTIPGAGEPSVQVLLWSKAARKRDEERLFSAGLNGRLIEWDLTTLKPRWATDTYGGAVWGGAIAAGNAARPTLEGHPSSCAGTEGVDASAAVIALGCEDGTVRLFDVSPSTVSNTSGALYLRALSRHSARVLSVAFAPEGGYIATGAADGMIKLWDLRNEGRNIQRITVENRGLRRITASEGGAGARTKPAKGAAGATEERYVTLVWSITFLSGNTLLSGDSLGNLQIWDLEFGTLLQSFPKALLGDVLSVVTNKEKTAAYAAGVEGKIVELKSVGGGSSEAGAADELSDSATAASNKKWVLTANHRHHTHDVYALAVSPVALPVAKTPSSVHSPKFPIHGAAAGAAAQQQAVPGNNYLLVSGGVDTQLLLSPTVKFPDYASISRILPFAQGTSPVVVADRVPVPEGLEAPPAAAVLPPRFLVASDQSLSLYSLGSVGYEETGEKLMKKELAAKETESLALQEGYKHLLDINVHSRKVSGKTKAEGSECSTEYSVSPLMY